MNWFFCLGMVVSIVCAEDATRVPPSCRNATFAVDCQDSCAVLFLEEYYLSWEGNNKDECFGVYRQDNWADIWRDVIDLDDWSETKPKGFPMPATRDFSEFVLEPVGCVGRREARAVSSTSPKVEAPGSPESPTTAAPTTEAPTTEAPTTEAPTTAGPTTEAPTESPTTAAPTTEAPTESPTTAAPTTEAPTTEAPTRAPTAKRPASHTKTQAPTTASPTQAPTTASPTTLSPTAAPTDAPTTPPPDCWKLGWLIAPFLMLSDETWSATKNTSEKRIFFTVNASSPFYVDILFTQTNDNRKVAIDYTGESGLLSWDVVHNDSVITKSKQESMIFSESSLSGAMALESGDEPVMVAIIPFYSLEDRASLVSLKRKSFFNLTKLSNDDGSAYLCMFMWSYTYAGDMPVVELRASTDSPPANTSEAIDPADSLPVQEDDHTTVSAYHIGEDKDFIALSGQVELSIRGVRAPVSLLSCEQHSLKIDVTAKSNAWTFVKVANAENQTFNLLLQTKSQEMLEIRPTSGNAPLLYHSLQMRNGSITGLSYDAPLWISIYNHDETDTSVSLMLSLFERPVQLVAGERTLPFQVGTPFYAFVDATADAATLRFFDDNGCLFSGSNSSVLYSVGPKWPTPVSDTDYIVKDLNQDIELPEKSIYHFRLIYNGLDFNETCSLKYQLIMGRKADSGYNLGVSDVLAIVFSLVVVALIFSYMAVVANRFLESARPDDMSDESLM